MGSFAMTFNLSRRQWLAASSAAVGAGLTASTSTSAAPTTEKAKDPFRYMLNTATIRGQKLQLHEEVDIAAWAGYDALELWIDRLTEYVRAGGSLKDLAKRIRDKGLTVESAIGYAMWIVDDATVRNRGLEEMRRAMDMLHQLGGKRIAASPAGAVEQADLSLMKAADRYLQLLELGDKMGIVPMLEPWSFSQTLSRLSEAAFLALESHHPRASILLDVFHLYKSGSQVSDLHLLNADAFPVFQLCDYPSYPPREKINDYYRVFPGDGAAPLKDYIRQLRALGFRGLLSLELFNKDYYKDDAQMVARTGLQKMKAVVEASR